MSDHGSHPAKPSQKIWLIAYPYTLLLPELFSAYSATERNMGKKKHKDTALC